MMATYTPEQYGDLLERFAKGLPKVVQRATLEATKTLEGNIKRRVFNKNGTKDINGGTRGYRSERWVTEREDAGLQVNRVDLSFTGNLQRSIKLVDTKKTFDIKIIGEKQVDKARGNEDIFEKENGSPVFEASKAEENEVYIIVDEAINKYINKLFD